MNRHSWEPTEKPRTYRLRCDVTEAADALAAAVEEFEPFLFAGRSIPWKNVEIALAEYRKLRPVASQDARSAEKVDQHAALLDERRYADLMARSAEQRKAPIHRHSTRNPLG